MTVAPDPGELQDTRSYFCYYSLCPDRRPVAYMAKRFDLVLQQGKSSFVFVITFKITEIMGKKSSTRYDLNNKI